MGTLEARFRFDTHGMALTESVESVSSSGDFRVKVSSSASDNPTLDVLVTLDAPTLEQALRRAEAIVDAVYERFLLDLSPHVAGASKPVRVSHTFSGGADGSMSQGLAVGMSLVVGVGVAVLAPLLVKPVVDRAVLGVEVGQSAIAARLYSARSMFRVAMETDDAVASYLVCYSALALAALFKLGPNGRGQSKVDGLLLGEDPGISQRAVTRSGGYTATETIYTEIRNQFVHAEERGEDPAGAAQQMAASLAAFRDLTARILRKL